ncbi:hypothetical protein [Microbacterium maritypicum]|jgi:hypothetical protein|uniref:Uncharacterized protein n=2 Tax=Microbacterium maritypicum TaxID=33918 RepID=A0A4Y4B7R4_MICMQ|nr:hypothetical protein [Microbacterium liquefaciens]KAB1886284.1 hypothetical protein F6W70_02155 [Microbacterium liquefaciens]WKT89944.1 hypothetical protein QYR02_03220 [Microbacterium liquefaciens]GEC76655.1 hypothetical protein MLI01_28000 [Microbacterium liquefaciens]GGV63525.1 hypothetical protein GCM10010213_28500 [Microbacterium liquefaciens]
MSATIMEAPMPSTVRLRASALLVAGVLACAGCSAAMPSPPAAVGDGFPGTCLPSEVSWPSDFLESLPGESEAIGGTIVGLRLEWVDSDFVWRLRSADTRVDMFGERVDDPAFGRESLVDVRTLEVITTGETELTEAEQQMNGSSAYSAAQLSGEEYPSPLIVEMARVMEDGSPAWRLTMCDTATNEMTVTTLG